MLEFADFKVSPIRVEHSIPDTYGLIFTDKHQIFDAIYISDYKFDQDLSTRILNKCKSKSRVLFSDSTNVLSNKKTLTEAEIITELSDQINKDGRTFITCFASNTFRLQSILDIAKEQGKRVVLHGRSLHFYSKQAIENNLLIDHGKVLREVASIDPEAKNLIVVLTGCQGEFRGTLRRVSFNDDSVFKITENDKFIFSSKTIPGNEFTVTTILNTLSEQNIPVITAEDAKVHASGHISGDELLQFYKELGPDFIIPIHGESFFLRRHVQMINDSTNGPKAIYLSNGDRLILKDDNTCTALSNEEDMPILINGEFSELNRDALSERRKAAETGTVFVSINFESIAKKRPKLSISSLGLCKEGVGVLEDLNTFLVSFLRSTKIKSKDKTTEEIRIVIRRFFIPHIGLRPMAIVHFI